MGYLSLSHTVLPTKKNQFMSPRFDVTDESKFSFLHCLELLGRVQLKRPKVLPVIRYV